MQHYLGDMKAAEQEKLTNTIMKVQDTEGMQTMRTLADNMAWLLKKIHANGQPDYPEREPWQGMNFIR